MTEYVINVINCSWTSPNILVIANKNSLALIAKRDTDHRKDLKK